MALLGLGFKASILAAAYSLVKGFRTNVSRETRLWGANPMSSGRKRVTRASRRSGSRPFRLLRNRQDNPFPSVHSSASGCTLPDFSRCPQARAKATEIVRTRAAPGRTRRSSVQGSGCHSPQASRRSHISVAAHTAYFEGSVDVSTLVLNIFRARERALVANQGRK